MSVNGDFLSIARIPNFCDKFFPEKRSQAIKVYRRVKQVGTAGAVGPICISQAVSLVGDVAGSKLKANSYKFLFATLAGPFINAIAVPIYIFSYGSKLRKFAILVSSVGSQIIKGEIALANLTWLTVDYVVCGEVVPMTEKDSFMLLDT